MRMSEKKQHIEEEWMTPDQVELVNDRNRRWEKKAFACQSDYSIPIEGGRAMTRLLSGQVVPEGARLEPNAWDHEHCALCWKKIMEKGVDFQEGYTDGKHWLCPNCYEQYLTPKGE